MVLQKRSKFDECLILVKAQPHRSSKYFETVCCAGVGRDQKWRRQYPVPFRILGDSQKFRRWDWIKYQFTNTPNDLRKETQRVLPESFVVSGHLKKSERAAFINPLIRHSFEEANSKNESLTLIRPQAFDLEWIEKTKSEIEDEKAKHTELANQLSFLGEPAKPLVPCPIRFISVWHDGEGKRRRHECDDWETSAAFNRFETQYSREKAIEIIQEKYASYQKSGLVFAFSTHSRRNITHGTSNQWLLVGIIRLDEYEQGDLFSI
jgi:hypothetical protein